MKCLFIVPTIMTRPQFEINNVENIAKTFPKSDVVFVSNIDDLDFKNYIPKYKNIKKRISGKLYSISKALNTGLKELTNHQYISFIQSDMIISKDVIQFCKKIVDDDLKCGVVGVRSHSTFNMFNKLIKRYDNIDLYRVLWSDGIMFWSKKLYDTIGDFDEIYLGDKESQDYCYRAHQYGYHNYYFRPSGDMLTKHNSLPFEQKTKYNSNDFMNVVHNTKNIFRKKWEQWEKNQKHLFV